MAVTDAPTFTEIVPQHISLEPLKGPVPTTQYLDRFPEEIYNKAPETRLVKFMQTLLGPSGVAQLRLQAFKNRLALEAAGVELFDLDSFYGNPFKLGRITNELYDEDIFGVLTQEEWDAIKDKDEQYRSRALDFMNGARAGNSPFGMRLVARSGLGHETEIVENYRYLFDIHSDDPLGLPHYGSSFFLEEFVVLPRQATPRNEAQTLTITGPPSSGTFRLAFNGEITAAIPYDPNQYEIQDALNGLAGIGANGTKVRTNGTDTEFTVTFIGQLSSQNVPRLEVLSSLTGGNVEVETIEEGVSGEDEVVHISTTDKYHLQSALDRIRPVHTLFSTHEESGNKREQFWSDATATSEYTTVVRFVTGNPAVKWKQDTFHWIESNREKEAKHVSDDLNYHYTGFHNIASITASSEHIGRFRPRQVHAFPYLKNKDDDLRYTADRALPDYNEPLAVETVAIPTLPTGRTGRDLSKNVPYVNGIYPLDYLFYPGVSAVKYKEEQFWASQEAREGTETLLIDFGSVRAVNYIQAEIARKPLTVKIEYDVLDQPDRQKFVEVTPSTSNFPSGLLYSADQNPWATRNYYFEDSIGRMIYTRYIKISFTRNGDFIFDNFTLEPVPWSVDVQNLRIGRSVANY